MEATATIPTAISERLADIDRERELVLSSIPYVLLAESVAAKFPDSMSMVRVPNAGRACHYIQIRESMREAIAVLREYRKHGMRVERFHDHENRSRCYRLTGNVDLYVTLPYGEGAACRFVQVGTKTVPVMELRCEKAKA